MFFCPVVTGCWGAWMNVLLPCGDGVLGGLYECSFGGFLEGRGYLEGGVSG